MGQAGKGHINTPAGLESAGLRMCPSRRASGWLAPPTWAGIAAAFPEERAPATRSRYQSVSAIPGDDVAVSVRGRSRQRMRSAEWRAAYARPIPSGARVAVGTADAGLRKAAHLRSLSPSPSLRLSCTPYIV
jgi:hypothetical protein